MMLLHLRPGHGEEQESTVFWAFSKPDGHVSAQGVIYRLPIKTWLHTFREASITGVTKHIKP